MTEWHCGEIADFSYVCHPVVLDNNRRSEMLSTQLLCVISLILQLVSTSEGHLQASSIKYIKGIVYNCTQPLYKMYTIPFMYCILLAWSLKYVAKLKIKHTFDVSSSVDGNLFLLLIYLASLITPFCKKEDIHTFRNSLCFHHQIRYTRTNYKSYSIAIFGYE
jgi:cytochrome c biogenesis factor